MSSSFVTTPGQELKQVTVVGCGLIGSSFALALKKNQACDRILGWDTSASILNEALEMGVIDDVDHAFSAGNVSASDLIYLAMPILQIVRFMREGILQTKSGAIITDAGSTKGVICRAAAEHLPDNRHFIGGHPIAGSHLSGVRHASAELFSGATYVLTTDNLAKGSKPFNRVHETVEALGARVKLMSAFDHDRLLALVSHLPQLLSSALARTVAEQHDAAALIALAGPGYKDTTRLAGSSWSMWSDVLATNSAEIATALDLIIRKLISVRNELHRFRTPDDSELDALRKLFNTYDPNPTCR
ncbi:MAG TPA: prephenate dehydrogenase/arogenate dehydrogenase family protein [Blastocatellia bacterium]|nr:prephenate dehydrogenase/arogenate dehydrogenase family protein [Blastocatellia bacterium]